MAKLHIDVSKGIFEVEGDPELIRDMFAQFKSDLVNIQQRVASAPQSLSLKHEANDENAESQTNSVKQVIHPTPLKKRKKAAGAMLEIDKDLLPLLQTGNLSKGVPPFDKYIAEKFDPKSLVSNQNFVVISMYYLAEKLEVSPLGLSQLYTCFRAVKREVGNLNETVKNCSKKNAYLDRGDSANLKLYPAGINFVEKIEI